MTNYVPAPSGHPGCGLVLSALDERLFRARQDLACVIRNGAEAEVMRARYDEYERAVEHIAAVYRTLSAVNDLAVVAISGVQSVISEYLHTALGDKDHQFSVAVRGVCALESLLPRLFDIGNLSTSDMTTTAGAVYNATLELKRVATQIGREAANAVTTSDHVLSDAWRTHAFSSADKLHAHAPFTVPTTMRNCLMRIADPRTTVEPGSTYADVGWQQLSATPTGMRLGALARYGVPDHVGRMMLIEQLLVDAPNALLNATMHSRLRSSLEIQPNAAMRPGAHVPVLALVYAVCSQEPHTEADLSAAVENHSSEQLAEAMRRRVAQFEATGLTTRDDRRNACPPHINSFFAMAAMLFFMAKRLSSDSVPTAEAARALCDGQRQFCAIMRCLMAMRDRPETATALMARLLFWIRYAERGEAHATQFWAYTLRKKRLLADVAAFAGVSGMWSGTSWTLNVSVIGE